MKIPVYIEKRCELCDSFFKININNKRSSKRRFCCGKCAKIHNGKNNKGKIHTEEMKRRMSEKNSSEGNPFYGKKHTPESIEKMKKSAQWDEKRYKYSNMNEKEKEIFDGIMLSDGCLYSSRISSRLSLGFKYRETLERIITDLNSLKFSNILEYKSKEHKKTGKRYTNYFTKSSFYRDLLSEYNRWYINKNKIVPPDIQLTPLTCYWWYVCDGYLLNNNVYLCTDSFDEQSLYLLKIKLESLDLKVSLRKNKRIFLDKKSSKIFLKWLSSDIDIQKEYSYKWKLKNN